MATVNQRIGEYVLDERLGSGAFGEVWRARHHVWSEQLVAVKLPTDTRYVRNLQRQGLAIHGIVHPNIVRAIGCDPYANPPYLTMEYVPGTSLRALMAGKNPSTTDAIAILVQVLQGLKCAHQNGLLHLDIKPENILIHERASTDGFARPGSVKITDFGLGAAAVTTAADSIAYSHSLKSIDGKSLFGTLPYIAPEHRDGASPDASADLYACGVVLFEMLTGERPAGTDLPSDLNPKAKYLDEVFRRAYARRDKRFASADDFLQALAATDRPNSKLIAAPTPNSAAPQRAATIALPISPSPPDPLVLPSDAGDKAESLDDPNLFAFDERTKQQIRSQEELETALRELYYTRQLSGDEIDSVRKRLTAWADSIPHHSIREFGQLVNITRVIAAPYYKFTLRTQYESREVERKEEPYRGGEIPPLATNEANIPIWAYQFPQTNDFSPSKMEHRVEDSQEVRSCERCNATGITECDSCDGEGQFECPRCFGKGSCGAPKDICIYCSGLRRDRQGHRCLYCGGSGASACSKCEGTGAVPCEACKNKRDWRGRKIGKGLAECRTCDGFGSVVSLLVVRDTFEPVEYRRLLPNGEIPDDCASRLHSPVDYRMLLQLSSPSFAPSVADGLGHSSLKAVIKDSIETAKSQCKSGTRIVKQSIEVGRADVFLLNYVYGDNVYHLCLHDDDLKVLAPTSPFSEATERVFDRAAKELDAGELADGLGELSKIFDISQADKRAKRLLKALRARLPEAYMRTATGLSSKGLWLDSLHYICCAKLLVPMTPTTAKHKEKAKTAAAIVHLAPSMGVGIAAIIVAASTGQSAILLSALAAVATGIACYFLLGVKIRRTTDAVVHSALLSAGLAFAIGWIASGEVPVLALAAMAGIVLMDVILFQSLKAKLLRAEPPKSIGKEPREVIQSIGRLISQDWRSVGPNYLALPPLNPPDAAQWYLRATESGDADAQHKLGLCYARGDGVERNLSEAVKWYRNAAEQGCSAAENALGDCYLKGIGVDSNASEAVSWYRRAADHGDVDGQCSLGDYYNEGRVVKENGSEAMQWYRKAAQQGHAHAQLKIKRAKGDPLHFAQGEFRSLNDTERTDALKCLREAAEWGYVDAQVALADYNVDIVVLLRNDVEEYASEAIRWYQEAAQSDDASAQYGVGYCYCYGVGIPKEQPEAVRWYLKAAEQGHTGAMYSLGFCYYAGWGVEKSHSEAAKWYCEAAEQGDAKAQAALGDFYRTGDGVKRSIDEATKWFRKAAEQGEVRLDSYRCREMTGFANGNGQENVGCVVELEYSTCDKEVYRMKCKHCGNIYGVYGSKIEVCRCPKCQRGAPGPSI